jgi:hypothetical protein
MAALSAAALLAAWEQARAVPSRHRAAVLVRAIGFPAQSSIGARDAALLSAYAENFGSRLDGLASCPSCRSDVELSVPTAELAAGVGEPAPVEPFAWDGATVHWRLPDDEDLAAVRDFDDAEEAAQALAARCIVSGAAVSDGLRQHLAERIAAADPYADITFELACPECGHVWESSLDLAEFVWVRLRAGATALLHEVHELASAYGWTESEILALPQARRDAYRDLVRHG